MQNPAVRGLRTTPPRPRRTLESVIRTLTLARAWRVLMVSLVLTLALARSVDTPRAFAADKDNGSITGVITVEAGGAIKPVAGADVRLTSASRADVRRTGADGRFQFVELPAGAYTITIAPPDGLRPKVGNAAQLALKTGEAARVDFGLVPPTTTPAPGGVPPTAGTAPNGSAAPNAAAKPGTGQASATPAGASAAPGATPAPSPTSQQQGASPTPAGQRAGAPSPTASPAPPVAGAPSPAPLALSTPSLIFPGGVPSPAAILAVGATPNPLDDPLASGPPRRLITSFAALRDATGSGSASQLKSWATDSSLVLGVPFRTQIDGTTFSLVNCGPASLAMVLLAFGLDVDPASVRDYLNYLVGNYDNEQGTSLYVLARIAREAGLSVFGSAGGLQGWTVEAVREQIRAGHPVITLTKYRRLPGHFGSVTEFDHYIVITGLAGEDFVYNDAAYSTEYGYNLLISPAQLERAWADSSVPRHAVAIGFGDSLRPLPIVPNRLTAESLAALPAQEEVQGFVSAPVRASRGPAAERLRDLLLDRLGARGPVVGREPTESAYRDAPVTRLDPADVARLDPADLARLDRAAEAVQADPRAAVDEAAPRAAVPPPAASADALVVPAPVDAEPLGFWTAFAPLGLALMGLGLVLTLGGAAFGRLRLGGAGLRLPARRPIGEVGRLTRAAGRLAREKLAVSRHALRASRRPGPR